jgi:hypothetical protein
MQQNFDITDISLLFPRQIDWVSWSDCKPDIPFSDKVMDMLNALSSSLLKDGICRQYPDVITFAFFCRRANILKMKEQYLSDSIRLGRGVVFHIAPSNVPINFAYSLIAGLLAGNRNIVRVSSKEFQQVDIIVKHLYKLQNEQQYSEVLGRIALVRYGHESLANDYFSSICHARVIWGGDETIARIRKSQMPSRAFDVTFADRYSFAVINANELVKEKNIQHVAEGFYNDTYLFDQNACSAPHLVVWLGNDGNRKEAKSLFWNAVYDEVKKKDYHFQSVMAVDKLTAFYKQSQAMDICLTKTNDNILVRTHLSDLSDEIDNYRCNCGYFSEFDAKDLNDIIPIIKYKYQTMAYYGISKDSLQNFVISNHLRGIDRIVPIGETANFSLTWDGYNLIETLSRIITIE